MSQRILYCSFLSSAEYSPQIPTTPSAAVSTKLLVFHLLQVNKDLDIH